MNQNAAFFRTLEGQKINQYRLEKLLGVGGFGGVFLASEVVRGTVLRQLALKIIPDSSEAQLAELLAATNLNHPHLIQSYSAGECTFFKQESLYLAMELAQGSLEQSLQQGRFNAVRTRQLIQQVASALVYLHSQKRVHRDLKPGNILQVGQTWKLSDFGLVRQMDVQSYVYTSNFAGTIIYMPPEGFESQISPAWDVWSLGIMLVEMTTGELPYKFNDLNELMKQVMNGSLQLPPLPKEFEPIILGCLQMERQKRWTAQQVLEAVTPKPTLPIVPTPQISSFTETLPRGVKLEMVGIPAGEFLMGSPDSDSSADDLEKPQHRVKVAAFAIGKYPITQEQYEAVMGNTPSSFKHLRFLTKGKHPVETVELDDAREFCRKLSKTTGRKYKLPSEAEWEYACRAGTQTRYYFGDNENLLGEYAWYKENSNISTHRVGEKKPNRWGLYDMHGNVREWCEDNWHDNYKGAPEDGRAWLDHPYYARVLRGGSWLYNPRDCRCASRAHPGYANFLFGFRVVCAP